MSDDTISRQAAIEAIKEEEYPCESDYDEGYMAALDKTVWIIETWLPSVQPERKKGKWKRAYLDHEAMGERPSILYCSICNQCIAYPTNYCPNCGADMRGEE